MTPGLSRISCGAALILAATGRLGRDDQRQVVLHHRLRPKLATLNPDVPAAGIEAAIDELTLDRSAMDPTREKPGPVEVAARRREGYPDRPMRGHTLTN